LLFPAAAEPETAWSASDLVSRTAARLYCRLEQRKGMRAGRFAKIPLQDPIMRRFNLESW
jgi:hypothetical protein